MPFNIQDFRSQLKFDGARADAFDVTMPFPTLVTSTSAVTEKLKFMCRAASLPGSTLNAVPINYFGREIKVWGNRNITEWAVTVINDEDFKIRNAFEVWMNAGNTHRGNLRNPAFKSALDYGVDSTVIQYGQSGNSLVSYKFVGMFPIDLSPIAVDWSATNTIEEYAVTFAYQWWEKLANTSSTGETPPQFNVPVF